MASEILSRLKDFRAKTVMDWLQEACAPRQLRKRLRSSRRKCIPQNPAIGRRQNQVPALHVDFMQRSEIYPSGFAVVSRFKQTVVIDVND